MLLGIRLHPKTSDSATLFVTLLGLFGARRIVPPLHPLVTSLAVLPLGQGTR